MMLSHHCIFKIKSLDIIYYYFLKLLDAIYYVLFKFYIYLKMTYNLFSTLYF